MNAFAMPVQERLFAYKHDRLLKRYQEEYGVSPEVAQQRFVGLKQFLYLCSVTPGYKVTSDAIDSLWHTFLLYTADYRDFCSTYFGKFINHDPFETPRPEQYLRTRTVAQELFGELDEELWPEEAKGNCSSGCGT